MKYAYIRVSTISQNIDRQMEEMLKHEVEIKNIFIDYQSGKDFERTNYKKLINKLRKNDLIIIKSIDRLGRDYNMIQEEWRRITKDIQADIVVIDMPLLDTRIDNKNLVGRFISDIVLQVLSFVAENERVNIKQRQAEGIRIAKAKGIHMGRPAYVLPDNFDEIIKKYINRDIDNKEARNALDMSRGTFFKYLKIYKDKHKDKIKKSTNNN